MTLKGKGEQNNGIKHLIIKFQTSFHYINVSLYFPTNYNSILLNTGLQVDYARYDGADFPTTSPISENRINQKAHLTNNISSGDVSLVKSVENPYYGDVIENEASTKSRTENIVVIQNPYYE